MTVTPSRVNQGAAGTSPWPVSIPAPPTITEKQDQPAASSATWTSATALNTAVTVATTGYGTANVFIVVPATVTAGVISIEVSNDGGTTYVPGGAVRVDNGYAENVVALAFAPGINGNRMYAVSVDAMTQVRARLSTVIAGTGNVVVTVSTVAGGIEPFVATRALKVATYRANFRAAASPHRLANAFAAAGRKQFATIHHAATATKTVRLRRVMANIENVSAASYVTIDLVRITSAPATGNPAITPSRAGSGDATVEATCLALPTTAATEEAQPYASLSYNLGITGAASTTMPPLPLAWQDLLGPSIYHDDQAKAPEVRAGVLEGWAVTFDTNAIGTVIGSVAIEFTEEAP